MYIKLLKTAMRTQTMYMFEIICSVITNAITIIIYSSFWHTLYKDSPIMIQRMTEYAVISQIMSTVLITPICDLIVEKVRDGDICVEMLRPWNLTFSFFIQNFGIIIIRIIYNVIPLAFIAMIFFQFSTVCLRELIYFSCSLFLAIIILFLFRMLLTSFCFWIIEVNALLLLSESLVLIFSGKIIPTDLMPKSLEKILNIMPFIWIYQKPIELLQNKGESFSLDIQFFRTIINQGLWILMLLLLFGVIWKAAIKHLIVQGG